MHEKVSKSDSEGPSDPEVSEEGIEVNSDVFPEGKIPGRLTDKIGLLVLAGKLADKQGLSLAVKQSIIHEMSYGSYDKALTVFKANFWEHYEQERIRKQSCGN